MVFVEAYVVFDAITFKEIESVALDFSNLQIQSNWNGDMNYKDVVF